MIGLVDCTACMRMASGFNPLRRHQQWCFSRQSHDGPNAVSLLYETNLVLKAHSYLSFLQDETRQSRTSWLRPNAARPPGESVWCLISFAFFSLIMHKHDLIHTTKREVHDVLRCGQMGTEPRPQRARTGNFVTFGRRFLDMWADRQTYRRSSQYFAPGLPCTN